MRHTGIQTVRVVIGPALVLAVLVSPLSAQELVPAAYTPAPVGVNLLTLAAGYNSGDLSFDPSLPVSDASASIAGWSLSYGRTLGVLGRSATITVIVPYVVGDLEGIYLGEQTYVERSGLADAVVRFGINLSGAPALDPAAFRDYRPRTLLGASFVVQAPTGQYDSSKLINIGTNRWGFKPEVGFVHVMGRWAVDAYVGGWFFTDNTDFLGGLTRAQDPILSTQAHVRRAFGPRIWAALDANFWWGGETTVNGATNDDLQRNSRVGLTCAFRLSARHSLRVAASRGAFTRIGGDFDSIGLSYSYNWKKQP